MTERQRDRDRETERDRQTRRHTYKLDIFVCAHTLLKQKCNPLGFEGKKIQ